MSVAHTFNVTIDPPSNKDRGGLTFQNDAGRVVETRYLFRSSQWSVYGFNPETRVYDVYDGTYNNLSEALSRVTI